MQEEKTSSLQVNSWLRNNNDCPGLPWNSSTTYLSVLLDVIVIYMRYVGRWRYFFYLSIRYVGRVLYGVMRRPKRTLRSLRELSTYAHGALRTATNLHGKTNVLSLVLLVQQEQMMMMMTICSQSSCIIGILVGCWLLYYCVREWHHHQQQQQQSHSSSNNNRNRAQKL